MAFNDKKILAVLTGELKSVPDRCDGYKEEVAHLIGDILNFERDHAISKTNVVQRIGDQINTVGMLVYKASSVSSVEE
jgi:hypothetical protein